MRWRTHGDPLAIGRQKPNRDPNRPTCTANGCQLAAVSNGYCTLHYARWRRLGDADVQLPPRRGRGEEWTREQWVAAFVSRFQRTANGCLEWTGNINEHGYGRCFFEGNQWFTHRLAYTILVGPIPDGMNVCHHCDNPPCGEASHLFIGDNAANLEDMRNKGRGKTPTPPRGESHPRTRLTETTVRAIRAAWAGGESQSAISRRLGIERTAVGNICNRKTWKHLAD